MIIHKPTRHALLGKMYQVTTYEKAFEDVDIQEWKRAMDREMKSMGSNLVWSLVEALRGVKPIGSKLIYKKNALVNHVCIKDSRYSGSLSYSSRR